MKRTLLTSAVLLALTAGLPSTAEADILWFKNGRSLQGSVRELPDGRVEITLPYGTLAFSRNQVERVEEAISVAEVVDQALATLRPGDAEKLFELAEWCREKREHTLAQRLYQQVLAADPDHAGARQRLGFEFQDGTWMSPEDARRARGEVFFKGRWVRAEDLRILEAQRAERRLERLEEARLALELSRLELEAERSLQPPASGVPLYPYAAGPSVADPYHGGTHSGQIYFDGFYQLYGSGGASSQGNRVVPQASPKVEERRPRASSIPRHLRGGFVAPRRN